MAKHNYSQACGLVQDVKMSVTKFKGWILSRQGSLISQRFAWYHIALLCTIIINLKLDPS
jgi:hypothetical protein